MLSLTPLPLKDINVGAPSSEPFDFVEAAGVAYFTADDGVHGRELWKSDGTADGTVLLKDIAAGPDSSVINLNAASVNGTLYFGADDGVHGKQVWKSDGTEPGTVPVTNFPQGDGLGPSALINVGGTLFFVANDGTHGREVWTSDGTAAGTAMVKDIRPGSEDGIHWFTYFTIAGDSTYFMANDGQHGYELWKSDGTAAGTGMVKDIAPGSADAYDPASFFDGHAIDVVGETVFFAADDGSSGPELWRSDGTEGGTALVTEMLSGLSGDGPRNLTNVNGTLFFVGKDALHGPELWRSDGTAAGTVMVTDIQPGWLGSWPSELTNVNGMLYFTAKDSATSNGVWKSDGTAAGTVRVAGFGTHEPFGLTAVGDALYFVGFDWGGTSLWVCDPKGARLVAGGPSARYVQELANVNGDVFFAAHDSVHGREPRILFASKHEPRLDPIAVPAEPITIDSAIPVSVDFIDSDVGETYTAIWSWGDGTNSAGVVAKTGDIGTVTGSHIYSAPGLYSVYVTLSDDHGARVEGVYEYLVVFDPNAGFVTGEGSIESPEGGEPYYQGQATFAFDARYDAGATVPTGQLEFHFEAADIDFHSAEYEWLVVAGNRAQVLGSGTIDGLGNYGFLVTVTDGQLPDGQEDYFRIWIWDKDNSNALVYDTQTWYWGEGGRAWLPQDPLTPLAGGDIVIHSPGTNSPPIAGDDSVATDEDVPVAGNVLGNDVDAEGDPLTAVLVSGPVHGTVEFNPDGSFSYTPHQDYSGPDSFSYQACDGQMESGVAAVTIAVRPANDQPGAGSQGVTVTEDGQVAITLSGSDVETSQDNLTFTITSLPARGTLTDAQDQEVTVGQSFTGPPTLVLHSGAAEEGPGADSFTFTVTDRGDPDGPGGLGLTSDPAAVAVDIAPAVAEGGVTLEGGILRIGGTPHNDLILVTHTCSGQRLVVLFNSQIVWDIPAAEVNEVRIWGRAGNDVISLIDLALMSLIHGGDGNDLLDGGASSDLIFGGRGDDILVGGAGNDLLLGGMGADRIVGSAGHDILVAGDVPSRFTDAALREISAAWAATKTVNEEEDDVLDEAAIDASFDMLTGGSGADWFIIGDGDRITDLKKLNKDGDVVTVL